MRWNSLIPILKAWFVICVAQMTRGWLTCFGIVDTPRSSIFYRYRRCVYEWSRNFTSEKAV